MYVDKVLVIIALCTASVWCNDQTLIRNIRTIDPSSFFTWPQMLFKNLPNRSIFPNLWPSRSQLQELTKSGVAGLLRLIAYANNGEMHIKFRSEDGINAAKMYQRRFGYRGERLIEQLGNGLRSDIQPLELSSMPSMILMPPLSSFKGDSDTLLIRDNMNVFE